MAGRAEEDGVRVLAEAGSRTPETRADYSLHAKSGRGDRISRRHPRHVASVAVGASAAAALPPQ